MDVDEDMQANATDKSGSKKRFEVKKVYMTLLWLFIFPINSFVGLVRTRYVK